MKDAIRSQLANPAQLEKLYRQNKLQFKQAFNELYPEFQDNPAALFWHERLNYSQEEVSSSSGRELLFVVIAALLAGVIAKLPAILQMDEEYFYPRNIGFIVFPILTAYFAWKHRLQAGMIGLVAGLTLIAVLFINLLPKDESSDTLVLSCMHLLLFLWSVLGIAYVGNTRNSIENRLGYLRYNGDLAVITALILIAGGILSGITIGLFSLLGIVIERFYFEYIVVFGLAAAPIVGTYLTQNNPQLVGKVSPVIARIFSPLVLVMLITYLVAMLYSGKDPYNDREFLLLFNALLIGVMAIIFFSIAEASKKKSRAEIWILLLLSVVTIIVNCVALSAILFRISEWGITANRLAVLGSNLLILGNLVLVTAQLFKAARKKQAVDSVGMIIARYLPVYCIWTAIVTFVFPFVFGFR